MSMDSTQSHGTDGSKNEGKVQTNNIDGDSTKTSIRSDEMGNHNPALVRTYCIPQKKIHSPNDMQKIYNSKWFQSVGGLIKDIFDELVGYSNEVEAREHSEAKSSSSSRSTGSSILEAADAAPVTSTVADKIEETNELDLNPVCMELVNFLSNAKTWVAEIPLVKQTNRFGNQAFRVWYERMLPLATQLMQRLIDLGIPMSPSYCSKDNETSILSSRAELAQELHAHFKECFGNFTRIDYGTGHELAFISFLAALREAGIVKRSDYRSLGIHVMDAYLKLVREMQLVYMLEPAGSKGAWGLDDYQFIPFLWGTAQFLSSKTISSPSAVFNSPEVRQKWTNKNLLVDAVNFVLSMKIGPLEVHSPYLCNMGRVPTWDRVARGLFKMFGGEILSKFPVMQHVFFGSLLPLDPVESKYLTPSKNVPETSGAKVADVAALHSTKHSVYDLISLYGIPYELTAGIVDSEESTIKR